MSTWHDVGRALLGRWPSQVAAWGPDAIQAFLEELQADGLTPETALVGIRSYRPERDFPPSVATVTALAYRDPSRPTFEEAYQLIYGRGGILKAQAKPGTYANEAAMRGAQNDAAMERARGMHPLVGSFVERYGIERLRMLEVDSPDYGELKRRDLREAWERHVEALEGRDVAALASGRRGELGRFDPLVALGRSRPEIGAGT